MVKRVFCVLLVSLFVCTTACAASWNFDISAFDDSTVFDVEFDDMDDTGTISLLDGGMFFGAGEEGENGGILFGDIDVRIVDMAPPMIRISVVYYGEEWVFCDKIIIKPLETRYTFEVDRDTDVDGGKVIESFTIAITDQNIKMIEDILSPNCMLVRYRLVGDRNVDGNIIFDKDALKLLYDAYIASGALENDFSDIYRYYPCEIK